MKRCVHGIDLGSSYSRICYIDDGGRPVVVPNAEGEMATPSVAWFAAPGSVVIGSRAKDALKLHSQRVVPMVKRLMGSGNWSITCDGATYRPQEISAFILRKLMQDAAASTGNVVEDVVIAYPACFNHIQIAATRQAAEIAGLNVLSLIPEPTATAMAYGADQEDAQAVLVYDLGGGIFDLSLIRLSGSGEVEVLAVDGDDKLGGADWDGALAKFLVHALEEQNATLARGIREDKEAYFNLLDDAERLKVRLSSAKAFSYRIRHPSASRTCEVTRTKFDELTRSYRESAARRTVDLINAAARLGVGAINRLLMVGGSTHMPQIIERMSALSLEIKQFDPSLAVVKGAALFGQAIALRRDVDANIVVTAHPAPRERDAAAQQVAAEWGLSPTTLERALNRSTSRIAVTAGSIGLLVMNAAVEKVNNLVSIGEKLPYEAARRFPISEDNRLDVELPIMHNKQKTDAATVVDILLCEPAEPIGAAVLQFERAMPKGTLIDVTFSFSADGILSVHARQIGNGQPVRAEFQCDALLLPNELAQARRQVLAMTVS